MYEGAIEISLLTCSNVTYVQKFIKHIKHLGADVINNNSCI